MPNGVSLNVGYKTTKTKRKKTTKSIIVFLPFQVRLRDMIMLTAANLMVARQETLKFSTS